MPQHNVLMKITFNDISAMVNLLVYLSTATHITVAATKHLQLIRCKLLIAEPEEIYGYVLFIQIGNVKQSKLLTVNLSSMIELLINHEKLLLVCQLTYPNQSS